MIPEVPSNPNHSMTLCSLDFPFPSPDEVHIKLNSSSEQSEEETSSDPESKCTGHNYVASSIPKVKQENCRESLSVYKCGISHGVCHLEEFQCWMEITALMGQSHMWQGKCI